MRSNRSQKKRRVEKPSQKSKDTYITCGRNAVLDGMKSGRVLTVYVSESTKSNEKIQEVIADARVRKIKVEFVTTKFLDSVIGDKKMHQGVAAVCKKPDNLSLDGFLNSVEDRKNVGVVLLTEIEYEQNLGAVMRSMDASGCDALIVANRIKNADSMVVRKVSMGAYDSLNIFNQNIFIAINMLKKRGFRILGVEAGSQKYYINEDLSGKIALVFGGENKSLTEPVVEACDGVISIPMMGNVTSLNVSASVAVVIYERLRQIVTTS